MSNASDTPRTGGSEMTKTKVKTFLLEIPEAVRLASLMGMKTDMTTVIKCCDRMINRYSGDHLKRSPEDIIGMTTPLDFLDWEVYSTTACIRYARCFVSGVREPLDPGLLSSAKHGLREVHDFMIALRNKHIGHSVNAFEENPVTVHVGEDFSSSQDIESLVIGNSHSVGLPMETPAALKPLAEWWVENIEAAIRFERERVLKIVRVTPIEVIRGYGVPKPTSHADRMRDMNKRRPRP